jgi:hypothetical protein
LVKTNQIQGNLELGAEVPVDLPVDLPVDRMC